MQLSKNFTLDEMTHTNTGAVNAPNMEQSYNLLLLCFYILQPLRDKFGPIKINSGFRSSVVHDLLTSQGYPTSKTSQHLLGQAVDFVPLKASIKEVFEWAKANLIYGQIIFEEHKGGQWLHISLPRFHKANFEAMMYKDGQYTRV